MKYVLAEHIDLYSGQTIVSAKGDNYDLHSLDEPFAVLNDLFVYERMPSIDTRNNIVTMDTTVNKSPSFKSSKQKVQRYIVAKFYGIR